MDRSKDLSALNIVAIFAVFAGFAEFTILSPALNSLQQAFPQEEFTTILLANTITGVVSVPIAILVGATANKVGYKFYAILGYIFMILGCYPFFMPDLTVYWPIIFSRVIIGLGTGCLFPIAGAYVMYYFEGKRRATMLGVSVVVQYVFAMIYSQLGGSLAALGWRYVFLTYLVSILPLVIILMGLKEIKHEIAEQEAAEKAANAGKPKAAIDNRIWVYVVLGFIVANIVIAINFLSSILVDERAMGTAAQAGTISVFFSAGALVAGLLYGPVTNKIGKWNIVIFTVVGGLASIGAFFTNSLAVLFICAFAIGITDMMLFTSCQNCVGNLTHPTRLAFTNGIMSIMLNFGSFTGAYFLSWSQGTFPQLGSAAPLVTSAVAFGLFFLFALIWKFEPLTKKLYEGAELEEA